MCRHHLSSTSRLPDSWTIHRSGCGAHPLTAQPPPAAALRPGNLPPPPATEPPLGSLEAYEAFCRLHAHIAYPDSDAAANGNSAGNSGGGAAFALSAAAGAGVGPTVYLSLASGARSLRHPALRFARALRDRERAAGEAVLVDRLQVLAARRTQVAELAAAEAGRAGAAMRDMEASVALSGASRSGSSNNVRNN